MLMYTYTHHRRTYMHRDVDKYTPTHTHTHTQVESLMKHTVSNHGRIDFLVNNGGGQFMSPLADVRKKGWDAVIDTNLNGTYYCLKHGESPISRCFFDDHYHIIAVQLVQIVSIIL